MSIIIKFGILCFKFVYFFFKLLPTKNRVVMISRQSDLPSIEFKMIQQEVKQLEKEVDVVFLCKTMGRGIDSAKISSMIKNVTYFFHMFKQMYFLATSKVVILDSYCMLVSFLKHKKSLKVVQMWHSMGTMKLFGWSILGQEEGSSKKIAEIMHMHENYDYFFASSQAYMSHLAKGFNCPIQNGRVFPLPRYDILKDKNYKLDKRKEIITKYPNLKNTKNIVYCPTFRKDESQMEEAVKKLSQCIPNGFSLIVKLHPLSKIDIENKDVIIDKYFSSFDTLFIADYVISDYSCIIYEAAVLDVPIAFYNFDMNNYESVRGLAIDYENELPGIISQDAKEIMEYIKNDEIDKIELKEFSDKYVHPTEHATLDIANFIINLL
mgnify:CR=1 FL=1